MRVAEHDPGLSCFIRQPLARIFRFLFTNRKGALFVADFSPLECIYLTKNTCSFLTGYYPGTKAKRLSF